MIRRTPTFVLAPAFALVLLSGCGREGGSPAPAVAGPEAMQPGTVAAPVALQDVIVPAEGIRIAALLTAAGITPSNSEAGRKLKERAVKVDGNVVEDPQTVLQPGFEGLLQVGKRNFARVLLVTG